MRKDARKGEPEAKGTDDRRVSPKSPLCEINIAQDRVLMKMQSNTPRLPELKRPRKSGPFEYSDSEGEESSSYEIIEDINPSGHRTPNKVRTTIGSKILDKWLTSQGLQFIKLSHSAEAQSPSTRHVEQQEPTIRSQTDEAPQVSKEDIALAYRPQTTPPETTIVAQHTGCLESSSNSTGMSPIVLDIPLEQPAECHGTEMQVDVAKDRKHQQTQLQAPKQEAFPESYIRQGFAKEVTDIYTKLQSLCRFEEQLFSTVNQTRAYNSAVEKTSHILKKDYDTIKTEFEAMKNEKDKEITQLKADWQAERDALVQENALLGKRIELMKSALYGNIEAWYLKSQKRGVIAGVLHSV